MMDASGRDLHALASTVPLEHRASSAVLPIAVTALAAMGASISSQMVGLVSADLSGAFHVSADDGSWIGACSSMAEVAAIPIAATLVQAVSLKRVTCISAAVFGLCALASLYAGDLPVLLALCSVQSFAGGMLQVVMMLAVMTLLKPGPHRAIGLVCFAFASSAPAALAASVAGFMTEHFGWPALYIFDLCYCAGLLPLAFLFLSPSPSRIRVNEIDWLSYVILSIGLAALILVLSEGDRFFLVG
jgi:MFS transporter, DHA2 family, multidrug resistance protein